MDIAKIAFTVLLTLPILILILFLLSRLIAQLGKGSPQKGGTTPHDDQNSERRSVGTNTKSEYGRTGRRGRYTR